MVPYLSNGPSSDSAISISDTADVTLPPFPLARGSGSTASLVFDGGILRPAASSGAYIAGLSSATIRSGGATIAVAAGRDIVISQPLLVNSGSPVGDFTKLGSGSLSLTGVCSYNGPTNVLAGTLLVGASGQINAASDVTVAASATFGGSGLVGTVTSSGTVSPGTYVGTLTTGAVTLTGGSLAIEVSGPSADLLKSTGVINLSGASLTVSELSPAAAVSYVIADGSAVVGTFISTSLPLGYAVEITPSKVILKYDLRVRDYPTWSAVNHLDATNDGPEMDPDNDEVNNLMEYVLAGIPIGAGSGNTMMLPRPSMDNDRLFFSFDRSPASKVDTTQSISFSNDLVSWSNFTSIGNASEGMVTLAENGDKESVSVAIPRTNAVDGKLFARLEVAASFPIVSQDPGMVEISRYWAPVVYQKVRGGLDITRQLYGSRDSFVAVNFDGDWDAANNWENSRYQADQQGLLADRLTPPLYGKAYSAVVESRKFCFLSYGFYHSAQDSFFSAARHQNDWEMVVLVVRKDGTRFGKLEGMMTQFHTDQKNYLVSDLMFSEHRPIVYIEPNGGIEGHGIEAYSNQSPGAEGIVYIPGQSSENVTSVALGASGNWATAPRCQYKLIPISEMWGMMNKTGLHDLYAGWKLFNYARDANFPTFEHEASGGNPPWDRDFFQEPFGYFSTNFPNLQADLAGDYYVFNPYLASTSAQSGPANPYAVLPALDWQTIQFGGTSSSVWTHRAETTIYHKNGAGASDRFTFSQLSVSGDFIIQGRLHSIQDIASSQAGLMVRNSTADTAAMIQLLASPNQQVSFQYRSLDGGALSTTVNGPVPMSDQPIWLRLERKEGRVIASYSYQEYGGTFTVLASITIPLNSQVLVGMAAKSITTTYFSASTMTDLTLQQGAASP